MGILQGKKYPFVVIFKDVAKTRSEPHIRDHVKFWRTSCFKGVMQETCVRDFDIDLWPKRVICINCYPGGFTSNPYVTKLCNHL